ncbi:hypothetical protein [Nocardioides conyzicola]|uniref:Uncharacterized protein n=1 Tax=Nocardioides conyzicola TaxID=1651781 RepID=A0ABP8X2T9_9ACTN
MALVGHLCGGGDEMDQDRAEVETWADQHADDLVTEVERHGVPITRGEALWRLLSAVAIVQAPEYAIDDGGEPKPIEPGSDRQVWRRPDFVEQVAAGAVHFAGRVYLPVDLATSTTGVAIPWGVATELVTRLSALLATGLTLETSLVGLAPPRDLAPLIVRLSSRVAETIAWVGDDDIINDTKVNGRRYLLVRACDAWRAAEILRHAGNALADDESLARSDGTDGFDDLAAQSARHTFLWELDTWINPTDP